MSKRALSALDPGRAPHAPLYVQLATQLADAIRAGHYRVADALPSERALADSLGVSRVTARKAIDRLVAQGLIVRRHGSGNYIAPRIEQALSRLSSFSEELAQRGFQPSSQWLGRSVGAPAAEEQMHLGLSPDSRVVRLERLRLADAVVMAHELSVLPHSAVPDPQQVQGSLYAYLQSQGKAPVRALQHIRALNAGARLAEQLGVPAGQAVLHTTRIAYLASGEAVELTHSYCRSDYYDFVAELRRSP